MPIYEYRCESCDHELEALVRGGKEPESCPSCQGKLARKISRAGVIFKGSGFYVTDSRGGGSGNGKSNGSSDSSSKDSAGAGESKSGAGDSKSGTGESKSTSESKPTTKEAKSGSKDSGSSSKAAS